MSPTFNHEYSTLCNCGACRAERPSTEDDARSALYFPRPGRTYAPRPPRSTPQGDFTPTKDD